MNTLRIFLFGNVRLIHPGRSATATMPPTGQMLLAYLLLQPNHSYPRELLAERFWGDYSPKSARRCLNSALWRLRRVLEPEDIPRGTYLLADNSTGEVSFNWNSDHWLDMAVFEAQADQVINKPVESMTAAEANLLEQTLQLYTAELLEGIYDDWALHTREHLRRLYLNSLAHLMGYYHHHGLYQKGLVCGHQILAEDPLRERIHRQMMRLYLANRQRPLAIRQYRRCCEILKRELGIPPMPETQRLYVQILPASSAPQTSSTLVGEPVTKEQALAQLQAAKRDLGEAYEQLQTAIQLVEQVTEPEKPQ